MVTATRSFAGLSLDDPLIMGIVNVTPDSFSDGGDNFETATAIANGLQMRAAGAAILDVGGESTRPGAAPISLQEELDRVLPVIQGLVREGALVSIDTRHAEVMRQAVAAGAKIINDVTALTWDRDALSVAVESGADLVLMHMQGEPQTMQTNPSYQDVVTEVRDYLAARVKACVEAGIAREKIAVDPGIGFGKTVAHNLCLIKHLDAFKAIGCPVLLGLSRKSFIGKLSSGETAKERVPGSIAGALYGLMQGADILRVHDVEETAQAVKIWRAIGASD